MSAAERCSLVDSQAFRFPTTRLTMTLSFVCCLIIDRCAIDVSHNADDVADDDSAGQLLVLLFDCM